jgi:hypothetical protein
MLPFASREPLLQQQCWPLPGRHKTIVAILQRHLHSEPISHMDVAAYFYRQTATTAQFCRVRII